jgi:hypothetical protein
MPKSRGRKRPAKTHGQQSRLIQPISRWKRTKQFGGGFVAVVGFVAALVTFLPRITVEPGGQIDPLKPYPIPFTITNTGIIPLFNVQPAIAVCKIYSGIPSARECNGNLKGGFIFAPWFSKRLWMDEKYTIRLDDAFKFVEAPSFDISIVVEYEPWFLRIKQKKEFRFFAKTERDGSLTWMARPLDK